MAAFSEILKLLRKEKKFTQAEIAKRLECTENHYQKIEYGKVKPSVDVLIKLSKIFGVSVNYLLQSENNPITLEEDIERNKQTAETFKKFLGIDDESIMFRINALSEESRRDLMKQLQLLELRDKSDNPDSHKS